MEFVMRRHAVILAAALAWLVGNESAEAKLDILVDKATQRMLVIQNGYMRYMWPVSTGRDETATPNGIYTPQRMERNWFSTAYYNSPMPYSIFFHNGYAIHGSYAIDRLGGPASHGCVRLHPHHAALLFDLVQQEGPNRTTIEITDMATPGGPPPREMAAARGAEPFVPGMVRGRPDGPPLPPEIAAGRGAEPFAPGMVRGRPDGPPLSPREIMAGRGMEPPMPGMMRGRPDGPPLPPDFAAGRGPEPFMPGMVRGRPDGPPLPPREMGPGRDYARDLEPPPGMMRGRPDGPPPPTREMAAARDFARDSDPPLMPPPIVRARPDGPPPPTREMAAARDVDQPMPGIVRYRETGDMPQPPPPQRGQRRIAARIALPPRPPLSSPPSSSPPVVSPPATRRATEAKPQVVIEAKAPTNVSRAPCGAGGADESADCRPKPKVIEASPPVQPQPSQSVAGLKLLPTSCWSGGAQRWRWWGSGRGTPCK
jgi:L,D-transpeptidase catalytic domain